MTLLASRTASRLARVAASSSKVRLPVASSQHANAFFLSTDTTAPLTREDVTDSQGLLQFKTLHEMNHYASIAFKDNPLFGTYRAPETEENIVKDQEEAKGSFEWMTYGEYGELVDRCRTVLKDIGIREYDKIGLISNNRWEWAALASAAYSLNAAIVPMYETQLPKDWIYILNDSQCSALFCSTEDIFVKAVKETLPSTPSVSDTFCFDTPCGEPHSLSTAIAHAKGKSTQVIAPTPDDLAGLIYTSGTTGKPKGVELTHDNFVSNVYSVRTMADDPIDFIRSSDRSLAFLPWAHSYGQTCELWCAVSHGGSMGICRGVPLILEDLAMVQPSTLFAVPTLYKKVYDGVQNLISNSSPTKQKLMRAALDMGRKKKEAGGNLGLLDGLKFKVLDSLVTSKIRGRFGGNLRHGFVAGAACPKEIIEFMDAIGIPICEGYGLTETSPIIALSVPYPGGRKLGSVGKFIGGVGVVIMNPDTKQEARPGEEGEICCYGRNVMRGYYGNPEATAEVISLAPDGKSRLFHTGDLGTLDDDGFVAVTGRLKEQYKLENGKYVVPTPIEESVAMSRFVAQVVVCGANRPHNVALIVPDWVAIRTALKIPDDVDEEKLVNDKKVRGLIDEEIRVNTYKLKKYEVPQSWAFVAPFTAANNMLTPKMSIRRKNVIKSYEDIIGHMYGEDQFSSGAYDGGHKEEKVAA
mmetsp:Transcript_20440/g.49151  ORF Transcript_20440/g.49151 Transcript_20440/m.49151 type:complete len:695 (-) Transcript_20440:118-2202(-)|eukprot:CAMPEP_0181078782 /NCGR_PEP_ID=MMETSP1071-20121207/1672_1 /TAXON_ID=35127 /ORGANISM="Thalassiosira sp., Strain NH16" /LENGTH=694 /DNA_ID=CAMNT_0023160125 /DNA_START=131 /DNA_END=2215 /DNA_ORIENTATION=+